MKELKVMNGKQLPKLTRKQANFVNELINNPKQSATQAVMKTYDTNKAYVAKNIASVNLTKPNILQHLQANTERAEQKIVSLIDSDKEEIALRASQDVINRVHGTPVSTVINQSTGVTLTIDLTSALSDSE